MSMKVIALAMTLKVIALAMTLKVIALTMSLKVIAYNVCESDCTYNVLVTGKPTVLIIYPIHTHVCIHTYRGELSIG